MTRHAAEQGAELVKRLLAFARRQKLEPEAINVASLAGSVADLLEHSLGGLVELKWDVRSDIGRVYADPTQLELALMNLIINARDAMPEGGVGTCIKGLGGGRLHRLNCRGRRDRHLARDTRPGS
jgi:signal transduction histidine kinase